MAEEVKFKGLVIKESDREFSRDFADVLKTKQPQKFTVRIPLPYQKADIMAATSRATGGLDYKSMRPEEYEYLRKIITLNKVVVGNPEWWGGAENCPDDDFLDELWKFYLNSEQKFSSELKKNTGVTGMEKPG